MSKNSNPQTLTYVATILAEAEKSMEKDNQPRLTYGQYKCLFEAIEKSLVRETNENPELLKEGR